MKGLAISALIGIAACAPTPKAADISAGASCGDAGVAPLIGKVWTDSMRPEALKRSGSRTLRVIGPDTVVTMDYRIDRLNVEVDAEGRILRVRCG
jgi:hypothetical protein